MAGEVPRLEAPPLVSDPSILSRPVQHEEPPGGGVMLARHLECSRLAKADTMAVALACEVKHIANNGNVVQVAANAAPAERPVDAKAQAAGGDGCGVCGTGYFKPLRSAAGSVLGDSNAGDRSGELPVLFGGDSVKVGERNIGVPVGGASAKTIRICVRDEVRCMLDRPEGRGGFRDSSAVLGVVDACAVGAVPEGYSSCVADRLSNSGSDRTKVECLAVSAVTEVEALYSVTMGIRQSEGARNESESFE